MNTIRMIKYKNYVIFLQKIDQILHDAYPRYDHAFDIFWNLSYDKSSVLITHRLVHENNHVILRDNLNSNILLNF